MKTDIFNVSEGKWELYYPFRRNYHAQNNSSEPIMTDNINVFHIVKNLNNNLFFTI